MKVVQIISNDSDLHVKQEAHLYDHIFSKWGWSCSLHFSESAEDSVGAKKEITDEDIVIYHCDSYLSPDAFVKDHPKQRTIVVLHEHVQPEFYYLYEDIEKQKLIEIDRWLTNLIQDAAICIGHSDAACRILDIKKAQRIRKVPFLADFSAYEQKPDRFQSILLQNDKKKILFSGELNADSRVEDLIKTFWYFCNYEKSGCEEWQLLIHGRHDRCAGYMQKIGLVFKHYEIPQSSVMMASDLSQEELNAFYENADIYLTFDTGDFSGAGVMQAIHDGIPVIAYSEGAGKEVLKGTELLFDHPVHSAVAERIEMLAGDSTWREKILEVQRKMLRKFDHSAVEFVLKSLFSRFER